MMTAQSVQCHVAVDYTSLMTIQMMWHAQLVDSGGDTWQTD
jgi:hypothetical protein